jgi:recombination DNA repair RAD52 pathway protein
MNGLTHEQVTQLLRPINERRVGHRDGMSHLESYDVRAHLDRILGFGEWSGDVTDMTLLYEVEKELKSGKPGWNVAYRCTYRLTIHATGATYTEVATGDGQMPDFKRADAHDFAIKTAESQAFKRCAINLGDQFGLSLYQQGSTAALVGRTLLMPPQPDNQQPNGGSSVKDAVDSHVDAVTPETPAPEQTDRKEPAAPEATQPADAAQGQGTDWARILRDRVVNEAPKKQGNARKTFLLRQEIEAHSKGVSGAAVTDGDGNGTFLDKLIESALKAA